MADFQSFVNVTLFLFWGFYFLGLCFGIVWIFNMREKDIIETSENNLRIGLFFLTNFAQLFFVCLYAAVLFFSQEYKSESYIQVFVFFLAAFPTLFLFYSYFGMSSRFKKEFKLFQVHQMVTKDEFQSTELKVKSITEKLGLKWNPQILLSKYKNISPFVFGKTGKRSYLVLPCNWEEILGKVSGKDEKIREHLRKFVLSHELSHIKHKDHIFIGLSFLFLKSFKYWISATVLFVLVYSYITGLQSVKFQSFPLFLTLIFYGIFWLLSRSLSRHREYLADARVSLLADEKEIDIISTQEGNRKSYIESLLEWFYVFSTQRTDAVGISRCPIRFSIILNYISGLFVRLGIKRESIEKFWEIFFSHPENQSRLKRIRDRQFLKNKTAVISKESAIWIGIITIYLWIIPYLFSYDFLTVLQNRYNHSLFSRAFIAIFIIILFYMPLKASTSSNISYKKHLYFSFGRILIAYAASIVTHLVLAAVFWVSHPYPTNLMSWLKGTLGDALQNFRIYLLVFIMFSVLSSLHLFSLSYISNHSKIAQRKQMYEDLILLTYISLLVLITLSLIKIPLANIICGLFFSGIFHASVGIFSPIRTDYEKQFVVFKTPGNVKTVEKKSGIISLTIGLIYLPFTILFFVGAIISIQFQRPQLMYFMFGVFFLYGILIYTNMEKLRPSYSDIPLYLGNISKYLAILLILNSQRITEIKDAILGLIRKYKLDDDSCPVHKKLRIGHLDATYYVEMSRNHVALDRLPEASCKWLFNMEDDNGGFSPIKGVKARLESTFFALDIFSRFKMLNKINNELHACWIKALQDSKGYFSDRISISSKIKQTFYALSSLNIIGKLETINKRNCVDWIMQNIQQSKRDPESFYHSLKCLDILGELNEKLKEEVQEEWLPSTSLVLKNSKVESNISNFYYFYKIAEIVFGSTGDKTKTLIPGIEEKIFKSFVYYLKKR